MWRLAALLTALMPGRAGAHASEQSFVLLLPTDLYAAGGVATVVLTLVLVAFVPARAAGALFRPLGLWAQGGRGRVPVGSWLALAVLAWAVVQGATGPHDPTTNPLPLLIWSGFWLFLVTAQGVFGDLWRMVNPWTALWHLAGRRGRLRYPRRLGHWPGVAMLLAFAGFLLADIAPADPERLALAVAVYWAFHMAGTLVFGLRWLLCAEALTVLMRSYAGMALRGRHGGRQALGLPGWRWMSRGVPPMSLAVFIVFMLAIGSFDGVNETFWWLAQLGLNPLEFTGRSAVVWQNLGGLFVACAGLLAVFAATLKAGLILAESDMALGAALRAFAPSLLPIALGYHVAHYLPSMLVEGQYLALMLNDPAGRGWDLLGLAGGQVTTGFFNTQATVRIIWLSQAGAVVLGHVMAILMAHVLALRHFGAPRQATLSQLPLAIFMVLYTLFGLWLLASPRGA